MIDYGYIENETIRAFFRDTHELANFNDAMNSWYMAEQLYMQKN